MGHIRYPGVCVAAADTHELEPHRYLSRGRKHVDTHAHAHGRSSEHTTGLAHPHRDRTQAAGMAARHGTTPQRTSRHSLGLHSRQGTRRGIAAHSMHPPRWPAAMGQPALGSHPTTHRASKGLGDRPHALAPAQALRAFEQIMSASCHQESAPDCQSQPRTFLRTAAPASPRSPPHHDQQRSASHHRRPQPQPTSNHKGRSRASRR